MRTTALVCAAFLLSLVTAGTAAAQCEEGEERYHVTERGEDLYTIAENYFGSREQWSLILSANVRILGGNPNHVPPGLRLRIPCIGERRVDDTPDPRNKVTAEPSSPRVELRLLTANDYAPFTDEDLPNDGLVTEIVDAALGELAGTDEGVTYGIFWEDDWARHFDLLRSWDYDMGFPWLKPDCEKNPDRERCRDFHFSEPIFEMLVMLFVRADSPLRYEADSDIEGLSTICRPRGYYTHDLDRAGREWLERGVIRLVQPETPEDCFRMLVNGQVDAVSLNEFTGRKAIRDLGFADCVRIEQKPLSIEGLHAITYKRSTRGTTHRYRFNEGVRRLKEMAKYNDIVDRHMANFWSEIEDTESVEDRCPPPEGRTAKTQDDNDPSGPGTPGREPGQQTRKGGDRNDDAGDTVAPSVRKVRAQRDKVFFIYAPQQFLAPDFQRDDDGTVTEVGYKAVSTAGTGSGFLIGPDLVMTNSHVVAGSDQVIVANPKTGAIVAQVEDVTDRYETGDPDFALLRLDRPVDIEPVTFSPFADVLDPVVAMGYPGKTRETDRPTIRFMNALRDGRAPQSYPNLITTRGEIQSRRRNGNGVEELLHGSEMSAGNSGGPLVDACGRVVGINTLVIGLDRSSLVQYEAAQTSTEIADYLDRQNVDVSFEALRCAN